MVTVSRDALDVRGTMSDDCLWKKIHQGKRGRPKSCCEGIYVGDG